MPSHLLKTSPIDTAPPVVQLPPHIVELGEAGLVEQIDVSQELAVVSLESELPKEDDGDESLGNDSRVFQTPKSGATPLGSQSKSKRGKSATKASKSARRQENSQKQSSKGVIEGIVPAPPKKQVKYSSNDPKRLPEASVKILDDYALTEAPSRPNSAYIRFMERPVEELAEEVEYDLDEEDCAWLELVNEERVKEGLQLLLPDVMELLMDRLEKESYFQMQSSGMEQAPLIDDDAVCCICMDGECQNSNAILFCDMCNLAVHQECYGVPYIPEGQWLCRRCLKSPSRAVECVLCPNKGGAFKETEQFPDGSRRWAHVVCAIWIPEVCFANTVFLEPIDNLQNIPPARWKLCCFICKQKNVGACIQCYKSSCYTAFHVTCAQQAGLCMQMETVRIPSMKSGFTVKKTAYCDTHAPANFVAERDGSPTVRQKLKQTRKILAEKRCAPPVVSIPTIPAERVTQISSVVTFTRKTAFIRRLMAYWKLKRMSRNGVPLLRRLQAASIPPNSGSTVASSRLLDTSEMEASRKSYADIMRLRQDLERARLLCELIRKREKLKREFIYIKCQEVGMKITPFAQFLENVIDELCARDAQSIFTQPVDPLDVPDYLNVVKKPMDLATMRKKATEFSYESLDDIEADFKLMIENCMLYNSKETVFYRAATKMQELGGIVFREARRQVERTGYDLCSGTLTERTPPRPMDIATDEDISQEIEEILENDKRFKLSFEEHIKLLENTVDKCLSLSHPVSRKKKYMRVKSEIIRLKKRRRMLEGGGARSDADRGAYRIDLTADDVGSRSSVPGGASGFNNSIRKRLRSTDDQQTSRLTRRLSRSDASLGSELNQPGVVTSTPLALPLSYPSPRPGRGRPPKLKKIVGVRTEKLVARGTIRRSSAVAVSPKTSLRTRQSPQRISGGRGRGRGRGGRSLRHVSLRRSTRTIVVNQQQTQGQKEGEKNVDQQQGGTGSRNSSPPGKPRAARDRAAKQASSPPPGSKVSVNLRGRSNSPKSMELAAKSIVCERVALEKSRKRNQGTVNTAVTTSTVSSSPKLKRNSSIVVRQQQSNTTKAGSPGASHSSVRRNSAGKGSALENLISSESPAAAETNLLNEVATSNKRRKTPATSSRRKTDKLLNAVPVSMRNGPVMMEPCLSKLPDRVPPTNGLPLANSQVSTSAVAITPNKFNVPLVTSPKRRLRGSGPTGLPNNINNNNNNLVNLPLSSSPLLKRPDSFSVYRSGGDHDINSYSEGESANDDDEVEEEEEEEEEEEDEDDEEEDDDDEDEEEEDHAKRKICNHAEVKRLGNRYDDSGENTSEDEEEDEDDDLDEDEEDSDSSDDGSSSSGSESSSSSSSSLSSSSSSSKASSSSSTITTPKHFSHVKMKAKRARGAANASASSSSSSVSPSRVVRQQQASPTLSNNNNTHYSNKEREREVLSGSSPVVRH